MTYGKESGIISEITICVIMPISNKEEQKRVSYEDHLHILDKTEQSNMKDTVHPSAYGYSESINSMSSEIN